MAKKTSLGSTKRFGVRYGRRNREKVAILEKEHRGKHKCPFCNYLKVTRLSRGIWQCGKCNAKFAGKAYTYSTSKKAVKELAKEKLEELPEEVEETEELEEDMPEEDEESPEEDEPEDDESEKREE
ncbi:50S ribosomal protein L37ae [Candidatus Woesearchaeota archaeon]|nr:50S ribosomal protein L37ae [Candidatus Woesearchaeota archaeon]